MYRLPRFMLHYQHKQDGTLTTHAQPHSLSPTTPRPFFSSSSSSSSLSSRHVPTLSATRTPTFKRAASRCRRVRSKSSPSTYQPFIEDQDIASLNCKPRPYSTTTREPGTRLYSHENQTHKADIPTSDGDIREHVCRPQTEPPRSRLHPAWDNSWPADSTESACLRRNDYKGVWSLQKEQQRRSQSSIAEHSRLAKYIARHLPDVNSRCASAMVSSTCTTGTCSPRVP